MLRVDLLDTTVRDGSYAVDFQLTTEDGCLLGAMLDRARIPFIEIGHGWGIDVESQIPYESLGRSAMPPYDERAYFRTLRRAIGRAKIGAPLFASCPGITARSLDLLIEARCDFVRILIDAPDARSVKVAELVHEAKRAGLIVSINLLKTYAFELDVIGDAARAAEDLGADWLYVVDSAGCMRPREVATAVAAIRSRCGLRVGFHGHDNLRLAVANALAAVEAGASLVDGSLQGLGRATGNAPTEHLAALLTSPDALDRRWIHAASRAFVRPIAERGFEPLHVSSGIAKLHSDWLPRLAAEASAAGASLEETLLPLGALASEKRRLAKPPFDLVVQATHEAHVSGDASALAPVDGYAARIENAEDIRRLLRVASARDRTRTAVVLIPATRWHVDHPTLARAGEWSVAWIPLRIGEAMDDIPSADFLAVASELSIDAPSEARVFHLDDVLRLALDATATGALVLDGAAGVDILRRALAESTLPPRVVIVGPLRPYAELLPVLWERGCRVSIPDYGPIILALTTAGARDVVDSPGIPGALWLDVSAEATFEPHPTLHAAPLHDRGLDADALKRAERAAFASKTHLRELGAKIR